MIEAVQALLLKLRTVKPLILNLTNYVTMEFTANALLALGAAPLMTVYAEELDELIELASAIYINIGTLDADFIQRCQQTVSYAKHHRKPIILDPAGAGASQARTQFAQQLCHHVDIIRGNASEIRSLCGKKTNTLGVEALDTVEQAKDSATTLAIQNELTVVCSGPTDFITNAYTSASVAHGASIMTRVTGMGCTLTAIIAAFNSVSVDRFESTRLAVTYFGLCGEQAAQRSTSPGSFRQAFIDALYEADLGLLQNHNY
jgi:hydroxyethylthiazole kinase